MSTRDRFFAVIVVAVLLGGILSWGPITGDSNTAAGDSARRQTMQDLLHGLATAFGASLSQDQFRDAANRDPLRDALGQLAVGSEDLLTHGEGLGRNTERLRVAMAREAEEALTDFEAGRFDAAQWRVHQLLEHCFACHTRLPRAGKSTFGKRIAQGVSMKELELEQQVFFFVATRQFDKALDTIEAALRSPERTPRTMTWLFEAYLKLSIRVDRSYSRARQALESFLERSDPPPYLAARVQTWTLALGELQGRGTLVANLPTARALIEEGRLRNEFPADTRGVVHFVAASGLLLRFLEGHDGRGDGEAEAYFLLGVAESHISSSLWTDQTDFFLETAIQLRPHSELAVRAYSFLLEYVIAKHSGASGTFVPDTVRTYLDNLGALAEPAPGKR
jgi:hypothetical protein